MGDGDGNGQADRFGRKTCFVFGDFATLSMSADGNTVVAGAYNADIGSNHGQGEAYVFVKPATGWATSVATAILTTSDGAAGDSFGEATGVSADGGTIVVSAGNAQVGPNPNVGAAYVFVRPTGGWTSTTETARLTSSDGATSDLFGTGVAISGDASVIVVSAYDATVGANKHQGAAYVFVKPSGGWATATQTSKLTASDGAANDEFGTSVALNADGSVLAARAYNATVGTAQAVGASYVCTAGRHADGGRETVDGELWESACVSCSCSESDADEFGERALVSEGCQDFGR